MKYAETVIIGAGVVGASVAYHLTLRGAKGVVIFDRGRVQGSGSSGRGTGGIRTQFETAVNVEFSKYSLEFIKNCEFDCEYEPRGYLLFATSDDGFDYLRGNVEFLKSRGVEGIRTVGRDEIARICPLVETADIVGGSFGATDGFINPIAMMRGFTRFAEQRGAEFWFDALISSIQVKSGRVVGIRTREGVIECARVVLATGAWAHELAMTADVELPVRPERRQVVIARTAEPLPEDTPLVIDVDSGFYFRPARDFSGASGVSDGRDILFAAPEPTARPTFDMGFEESYIEKAYAHAARRSKAVAESTVVREKCRAGLYEVTPDHHAIIGKCEVEGLYLANGFSGHGVMHSPATGRALAEIILDGESRTLDVSPLSIDRFKTGKLLHERGFI